MSCMDRYHRTEHHKLLQCSEDTNNQNPVPSSVSDLMYADGMVERTKDPNTSTMTEMNSHKGKKILRDLTNKKRFNPLLTFLVELKRNLIWIEENCSPDNGIQCSTASRRK